LAGVTDRARFWRPAGLEGVEALHATFRTHRYRRHAHDTWTVALMQRGAAEFDAERRHYTAPPGRVFVIPPEVMHTGDPATPEGYTYSVLYLPPAMLERVAFEYGGRAPRTAREIVIADPALAAALCRLHRRLAALPLGLEEALEDVLVRLSPHLAPGVEPHVRGGAHPAVRRAKALLEDRWAENVALAVLADHAGLSRHRLVHVFREQVGLPPHAYQITMRVREAQRRVRSGAPLAQVALDCGFYDQAHLTRTFRAIVGVPPGAYSRSLSPSCELTNPSRS
jgi:AraC-like DNA-binding protein